MTKASLEFFEENIGVVYTRLCNKTIDLDEFSNQYQNILEQAKEMHKQEIIDTWEKADTFPQGYYNAEHYYNETFKNQQ